MALDDFKPVKFQNHPNKFSIVKATMCRVFPKTLKLRDGGPAIRPPDDEYPSRRQYTPYPFDKVKKWVKRQMLDQVAAGSPIKAAVGGRQEMEYVLLNDIQPLCPALGNEIRLIINPDSGDVDLTESLQKKSLPRCDIENLCAAAKQESVLLRDPPYPVIKRPTDSLLIVGIGKSWMRSRFVVTAFHFPSVRKRIHVCPMRRIQG